MLIQMQITIETLAVTCSYIASYETLTLACWLTAMSSWPTSDFVADTHMNYNSLIRRYVDSIATLKWIRSTDFQFHALNLHADSTADTWSQSKILIGYHCDDVDAVLGAQANASVPAS